MRKRGEKGDCLCRRAKEKGLVLSIFSFFSSCLSSCPYLPSCNRKEEMVTEKEMRIMASKVSNRTMKKIREVRKKREGEGKARIPQTEKK